MTQAQARHTTPNARPAAINCQHNHNSNAVKPNSAQWHSRQPEGQDSKEDSCCYTAAACIQISWI